jgi:hypothetical protein
MTPEAQRFLAHQLALLRAYAVNPELAQRRTDLLPFVSGALSVLQETGAITVQEQMDWLERAREAARTEAKRVTLNTRPSSPRGRTSATVTARHAAEPLATFVGLRSGPDEIEFFGGGLRLVSLELYDSMVAVVWRLAPLPDTGRAMGAEATGWDRDTAGLPPDDPVHHRSPYSDPFHLLIRFTLSDDVGTTYSFRGGNGSGTGRAEQTARLVYEPAPPPAARSLTFDALGHPLTVAL